MFFLLVEPPGSRTVTYDSGAKVDGQPGERRFIGESMAGLHEIVFLPGNRRRNGFPGFSRKMESLKRSWVDALTHLVILEFFLATAQRRFLLRQGKGSYALPYHH